MHRDKMVKEKKKKKNKKNKKHASDSSDSESEEKKKEKLKTVWLCCCLCLSSGRLVWLTPVCLLLSGIRSRGQAGEAGGGADAAG